MFRAWSRGAEHRCPGRKPRRTEKQPPHPLQHVRHVLGAFQDRKVRAGSEGFLTATEGRFHRAKKFSVH